MRESETLTIIQMNDSHGYFELHPELFWAGDHAEYRPAGGYDRIATIVKEARQANPGGVVVLDNGDTIHGTYPAVQSRGQALVPILNAIGFDAMTAHWDFAYGPSRLREILGQLRYPMLAVNGYDKQTGQRAFEPSRIVEAGGLRVGVVGIAATIIDKTMPPHFSEGLRFTLGDQELPGQITKLKTEDKVDLVVVLSHLGFPQDMKLAQEVKGIDVLLSGHTHNRLYKPALVGDTIIIQSGCHGSFLGRLDLTVQRGKVIDYRHDLVTVGQEVAPDPEVQEMIDQALAPHRDELCRVVGETKTPLNRNTVLEATMDNFLLDALRGYTGAQLAFSNGWRYGAPIVPGPVTVNDLWNIIPTNPPVSLVELTGEELWAMWEDNLERTFSPEPYRQMGGYVKRAAGQNLYFKVENPSGQRVQELFVGGQPVRADQTYTAAFVTEQGVPAKYGTKREHLSIRAIEALELYLNKNGPVAPELRGSVVAV
jgi:2',3'-cyclic-nucleotide 2'-phosphodiesterase (5'-nucleotidase family)